MSTSVAIGSYPSSIEVVKVSISLSDSQLAFLDAKVEQGTYPSRSAAIGAAVRRLQERDLVSEYAEMFAAYDSEDRAWIDFPGPEADDAEDARR